MGTKASPGRWVRVPVVRQGYIDVLRVGQRKRVIHGLFQADVTRLMARRAAVRAAGAQPLSVTASVAHAIGVAVAENPMLHALPVGRRVRVFDDVDINTQIEVRLEDHSIVKPHIIRAAQAKSPREIHDELRAAQRPEPQDDRFLRAMERFLALPAASRAPFWWYLRRRPELFRKLGGTVGLSAVGMFGPQGGWAIPISMPTLMVAVGGMETRPAWIDGSARPRTYLNLTVSVDHDIVDGAPAARFADRLCTLLDEAAA
ncbi:2-oxo acid dehydrogenase subunit E2 [Tessaracoccus oleiagri]|nr:2-oxo acid dehydrogenase subunit E2 [Tessaracoccus oleiagri]